MSTITNTISTDTGLRSFIKRDPLLSIYIIMFAIAWSVMIPQALYSEGVTSAPLPEMLESFTGRSPGIAALIVSAVVAWRSGVREVFGCCLIWRVGFKGCIVGTFLLAGIILGGLGLHVLFGTAIPFRFTVILTWAIALALIAVTRGKLGHRSPEE